MVPLWKLQGRMRIEFGPAGLWAAPAADGRPAAGGWAVTDCALAVRSGAAAKPQTAAIVRQCAMDRVLFFISIDPFRCAGSCSG